VPTYDLACETCDARFEVFRQGFLREQDRACTECGSGEVRQLFTGFVTSRPARGDTGMATGGCCGGGCGCATG